MLGSFRPKASCTFLVSCIHTEEAADIQLLFREFNSTSGDFLAILIETDVEVRVRGGPARHLVWLGGRLRYRHALEPSNLPLFQLGDTLRGSIA